MKKWILILLVLPWGLSAAPFRPSNINFPLRAPAASQVKFTDAYQSLRFNQPLFMLFAPDNSGKVFVLEQRGFIKVFPNISSVTRATDFADLRNVLHYDGGEMGLLGMAFSPDFAQSKEFFVSYTARNPNRLIVARMKVSTADSNKADLNSLRTVISIEKNFEQHGNHNGGMIAFGADRKLYIGVGDGGGAHDTLNHGQRRDTLWGKILRIDPLNSNTYSIPVDNPFVGERNVKEEIWAYGIRNPWRFSFDRESNELILADVGQDNREEIDIVKRGGNYGWRIFEGNQNHNNPNNLPGNGFIFPIWEYARDFGRSITGGYSYRGNKVPELKGSYIYGDYASGRIWSLQRRGEQALSNVQIGNVNQPASFAEDLEGEIYVIAITEGKIYKIEKREESIPVVIPAKLSHLGLFTNLRTLTAVEGLEEYDVNSPLWSDGAAKRRWIGLPATGKIEFSNQNPWKLPVGTILVKHFELTTTTNPHKKLETRVLFHHQEGWRGYTYVWNNDESDADLIEEAQEKQYEVVDTESGEVITQTWAFPSRQDCLTCHNFSAGFVLGANTAQLNRVQGDENFLSRMNNAQIFNRNIGNPNQYQKFANPYDTGINLQQRVRSYLAVNCAQCHNPTGFAPGRLDMRFHVAESEMNIIGVRASESASSLGTFRVEAGNPENSVLYRRMETLEAAVRMPPLATKMRDKKALELIREWIQNHP